MKCVVIDDEPVAIDILKDYIQKLSFLSFEAAFRDPIKALDYLRAHRIDLLFLDINMPDLSGIEMLKSLSRCPLVIFTTAYSHYAVESYDFDAVDYLLKPIEFERFLKAVNKAGERFSARLRAGNKFLEGSPDDSVLIKSGNEYHPIRLGDILYLQGMGNYVNVVTENKQILSLMSLKDALKILPKKTFIRIHKSYVINFAQVEKIESEKVWIKKNRIPIGETYREQFFTVVKGRKM